MIVDKSRVYFDAMGGIDYNSVISVVFKQQLLGSLSLPSFLKVKRHLPSEQYCEHSGLCHVLSVQVPLVTTSNPLCARQRWFSRHMSMYAQHALAPPPPVEAVLHGVSRGDAEPSGK